MSRGALLDLDVLVVGGGPAGAACAIRLARGGSRIAIVESSDFSRFRIGETLDASVRPLMLRLGVELAGQKWLAPCNGVAAAWGRPTAARRPSFLNPHGGGWCVDRKDFDRTLFNQARNVGAAAFTRCRLVAAERHAGSWRFDLHSGRQNLTGRAKWIVAATGRSANTPLAPRRSRLWIDRLVGIALLGEYPRCPSVGAPATAIVEATSCGWWYSVHVPDGRRIAVFYTDADLLPKGNHDRAAFLLKELDQGPLTRSACEYVGTIIAHHRFKGFDARSSIHRFAMSDGWTTVGDAMMAFDPLCGRGVSEAISSGIEAADWLLQSGTEDPDALPSWIQPNANRFNQYRKQW